jgi:hypothetical protein
MLSLQQQRSITEVESPDAAPEGTGVPDEARHAFDGVRADTFFGRVHVSEYRDGHFYIAQTDGRDAMILHPGEARAVAQFILGLR